MKQLNHYKITTFVAILVCFTFIHQDVMSQSAFSPDEELSKSEIFAEPVQSSNMQTTIDYDYLREHFSDEEIRKLYDIHPEIFDRFDHTELAVILDYNNRSITTLSSQEQAVIEEYYNFQQQVVLNLSGAPSLFDASAGNIVLHEDFSSGIPVGWEVEDISGSGVNWANNEHRTDNYSESIIADSDEFGEEAHIHTSITTPALEVGDSENVLLYLSHDYNHVQTTSARLEWSTNGSDWETLFHLDSDNRTAEETFDLSADLAGESTLYLRFTYDDDDNWGWWWLLDEIRIQAYDTAVVFDFIEDPTPNIADGDFFAYSRNMLGTVESLDFDLSVNPVSGSPWTLGFAMFVTTGGQPDADNTVIQIGGNGQAFPDIYWEPWGFGGGDSDQQGTLVLDEPFDFEGKELYVAHIDEGIASWDVEIVMHGTDFALDMPVLHHNPQTIRESPAATSQFQINDNSGLYSAVSLEMDELTEIEGIRFYGSHYNTNLTEETDLIDQFVLYIFEDENGKPAGDPETEGSAIHEYEVPLSSDAFEFFRQNEFGASVFIDIEELLGQKITLLPGEYWFVIVLETEILSTAFNNRWNINLGEETESLVALIDLGDYFDDVGPEWTLINDVGIDNSIAWSLFGEAVTAEPAELQVVHNSADPGLDRIDVYVDGNLVADRIQFANATAYTGVNAGINSTVQVREAGEADVLYETQFEFEEEGSYVMLIEGLENPGDFPDNPDGADTDLSVSIQEQTRDVVAGHTRLFVHHGVTDAPDLNFVLEDGPFLGVNLGFGETGDVMDVENDLYTLELRQASNNDLLFDFDLDIVDAPESLALMATGFLDPAENQDGPEFSMLAVTPDGQVYEIEDIPTSIDDPEDIPTEVQLSQNYPNPFNPVTQIQYHLPEATEVRLEVYNVAGQRVATLVNAHQSAGEHAVNFNAESLSSGVYLYRLQAAGTVITRKMMLVK